MKLWNMGLLVCALSLVSVLFSVGPATEWVQKKKQQAAEWKVKNDQEETRQPKHEYRPMRQNKVCMAPKTH